MESLDYFLVEDTMHNVAIITGLVLLLAANGMFFYRISKVKIKGIRNGSAKMMSIVFSVAIIGLAIWTATEQQEVAGIIISYGVLIALTRVLSPLAIGLTEDGMQYEVSGTAGGTGALAGLIRVVQFVPYKDIKEVDVESSDILRLRVKFSIRTLTLEFSSDKKEEVVAFLEKKHML